MDTLQFKYENDIQLINDDRAALSFACGLALKTTYSSAVSVTVSNEIHQSFIQKMNYAKAEISSANDEFYRTLTHNMKQGLPAIISVQSAGAEAGYIKGES